MVGSAIRLVLGPKNEPNNNTAIFTELDLRTADAVEEFSLANDALLSSAPHPKNGTAFVNKGRLKPFQAILRNVESEVPSPG